MLDETLEMAWTSVMLKKRSDAQETMYERFPKLDVAASNPISRSIFLNNLAGLDGARFRPVKQSVA